MSLVNSWFNIFGDMEEFEQIFNLEDQDQLKDRPRHHVLGSGSCSALIKVLPDSSDILTSHVTWNSYESMIRILKKYSFEIHETSDKDSPLIPGHSASFSSYPGLLYSGDDFTVLSSGLVAQETTIGNNVINSSSSLIHSKRKMIFFCFVFNFQNPDLWKYIKPTGQVLEGIRSVVANRLATTGKY